MLAGCLRKLADLWSTHMFQRLLQALNTVKHCGDDYCNSLSGREAGIPPAQSTNRFPVRLYAQADIAFHLVLHTCNSSLFCSSNSTTPPQQRQLQQHSNYQTTNMQATCNSLFNLVMVSWTSQRLFMHASSLLHLVYTVPMHVTVCCAD